MRSLLKQKLFSFIDDFTIKDDEGQAGYQRPEPGEAPVIDLIRHADAAKQKPAPQPVS